LSNASSASVSRLAIIGILNIVYITLIYFREATRFVIECSDQRPASRGSGSPTPQKGPVLLLVGKFPQTPLDTQNVSAKPASGGLLRLRSSKPSVSYSSLKLAQEHFRLLPQLIIPPPQFLKIGGVNIARLVGAIQTIIDFYQANTLPARHGSGCPALSPRFLQRLCS